MNRHLTQKQVITEFNKRASEKRGIIRVLSDRYSVQVNEEFDGVCKKLIKKYFPNKIKRVIDVGTGIGRLAKYFSKNSKEIIGVDFADKMLLIAKKYLRNKKNITLILNDAANINFLKNYFDLGIVSLILKHNSDKRTIKIINGLKKWCKYVLLIEHVSGGKRGSHVAIMRSESWYLKHFEPMKPITLHRIKRYKDNMIFCILKK